MHHDATISNRMYTQAIQMPESIEHPELVVL